MRRPEQVQWDFVQQWLAKARQDLRAGEVILACDLEDYETAGFHAQQAAEKFIKAVLVRHQVEFPKTHNLAVLRQLVARVDRALAEHLAPADALTPFGVEFRYPGDLPPVSREQGADALRGAREARDMVLAHLKAYLDAGRPVWPRPLKGVIAAACLLPRTHSWSRFRSPFRHPQWHALPSRLTPPASRPLSATAQYH
jgi:HEPN domain-containing protein